MISLSMKNARTAILIASTFGALIAGSAVAAAQPGADFQDQGIREDLGLPRFGELRARSIPTDARAAVILMQHVSAAKPASHRPRRHR